MLAKHLRHDEKNYIVVHNTEYLTLLETYSYFHTLQK